MSIEKRRYEASAIPKTWARDDVMRKQGLTTGKVDIYYYSRGMRNDASLVPPIRQTASIFKQPVTVHRTQNEGKVKSDFKHGTQDKPKQLFWEKRLEGLRACDVDGHEFNSMELPRSLKTIGPHIADETILQSVATALHVSTQPVTGQNSSKSSMEKNPGVFINPEQPLVQAVNISDEDIKKQEERVLLARRKLQEALWVGNTQLEKMEEAAVEENATNRFFCHKCSIEITRVLDDYTCPTCLGGFIEELDPSQTTSDEPSDDRSDDEMDELSPADVLNQFAEILIRIGAGTGVQRNQESRNQDGTQNETELTSVHGNGRRHRSTNRSFRSRARTNLNTGRGRNSRNENIAPVMQILDDIYSFPGTNQFRVRNDSPAPIEHMIQDFIVNLTGVGWGPMGPGGRGNGPVFFLGNPGDYAWGREGLDAIVTQLLNQMDVTGPPPLDKEKIMEIPVTVIEQEQVDSNLKCSVCWDDFKVGESVRKLECEHFYHETCIVPWLKLHGTCPICRKSLLGDQEDKQTLNGNGSTGTSGGIPDLAAILRVADSRASSTSPSASSSSASSTSTSNTNSSSGRPQPPAHSDFQIDFESD